jgi:hypothetical protein
MPKQHLQAAKKALAMDALMSKIVCGRTDCKYIRDVDDEGNWGLCCVVVELDGEGKCQTYVEAY